VTVDNADGHSGQRVSTVWTPFKEEGLFLGALQTSPGVAGENEPFNIDTSGEVEP